MPKLFFASDLHLSHPNILFYEPNRVKLVTEWLSLGVADPLSVQEFVKEAMANKNSDDFKILLENHDNMIIQNWNNKVKPDDTVIFLGDFSHCHRACKGDTNFQKVPQEVKDKIIEYGNKLNGHKIMIMGNHDWRGTYYQGPMKGMHYVKPEIEDFWKSVGFEAVYPNTQVFKDYFECSHEPSPYYSQMMVRVNVYGHVHSDARYQTEAENSFCACIDRHNLAPVEYKKFNNFNPVEE